MSISNRKPGDKKEAPTEPLKRSIAACLRAIARKPDLEVTFASDRPTLMGDKARLPEPPRKLNRQDVAIVRGHANSMALRLACHDPAIHRRLAPEAKSPRGLRRGRAGAGRGDRRAAHVGRRRQFSAMLEDRYHRGGKYEDVTDRADAPIEDAVALMVRERLTGIGRRRRPQNRRTLARFHRGARRARPRRASRRNRKPARFCAARCAISSPRST